MVKNRGKNILKSRINQEKRACPAKAGKIGPSTGYAYCSERLSPFGGLLGLVKFMDLVGFKEIFDKFYKPPSRKPKLGHYSMVYGLIMLLFIGFNRIWHFIYVQLDAMLCSILQVVKLPYVTTFWRYVASLGLNQGRSLLQVMSALRERVWHLCGIHYKTIHIDIDTTVETLYGNQEGGRKGHNTQHRGKKGFRPVLCFIEETREYFSGKLRRGETMGGEEVASLIRGFKTYLPGCVEDVILRGDGEFISWEAVAAALDEGYHFIFGNKSCAPPFDPATWYKVKKKDMVEYNECTYQPMGWKRACRFVVMRIPKERSSETGPVQMELLEDTRYTYRIFVTDLSRKAHKVIRAYDKRADAENLIGESKREGLAAIPSSQFSHNYAYFQIVMLSYNIWRSFKMLAGQGLLDQEQSDSDEEKRRSLACVSQSITEQTIRIARLKLLYIAAKVTGHSNKNEVKYSQHDSRAAGLFRFLDYLDKRRHQPRPWLDHPKWRCRHLSAFGCNPD